MLLKRNLSIKRGGVSMDDLDFSILIPCHNEVYVLSRKIENTLALGKRVKEVIIIDDHSKDGTYNLAKKLSRKDKRLLVLKNTDVPGKNFAVKKALGVASGKIICLTDADIILAHDTLKKLSSLFLKEHIGGACLSPNLIIKNKSSERYVPFYEKFIRTIKILESKIDSVPVAHGQALFFRNNLGIIPTKQADDADIAIQIRKKGYRVVYVPYCSFTEIIPTDTHKLKQQKIRRSKALIDSLLHHGDVFFNPRYGLFGFFCYPLDIVIYILSPFILMLGILFILFLFLFFTNFVITFLFLAVLLFLFSFTRYKSITNLNVVAILALYRYITEGSSSYWKTSRTVSIK